MTDQPLRHLADPPADLVRRARLGSAEALAGLYTLFANQVFGTALRILGNRADAEDVLQDVRRPAGGASLPTEQGRPDARFRRVAARTAPMRQRRDRTGASFSEGFDLPAREIPGAGIVERLAVADALGRMPEGLRQVFLLKEIEGFSHAEIGALLGISAGASGVRLHRAWIMIHSLLGTAEEQA
ncbi:MAG: sigma-70 family RNA polymerase sigma factor [Gemmatimonadales bacterium]